MATTARLGITLPVGTLKATSNAGGTTTTLVCANASTSLAIGDKFHLYTTADAPKEYTVFTVTNVVVAGSTTVTFTPAAAVATASTNRAYKPGTVDVVAHVATPYTAFDKAVILESCTTATRPVTGLYTGKLVYVTDVSEGTVQKWSGAAWENVCGVNYPMGRVAYTTTSATSTAVINGEESMTSLTATFTAYAGRRYSIDAGGLVRRTTGVVDTSGFTRTRWASGASVTVTDTVIQTCGADVADNGQTNNFVGWNHLGQFEATATGQVTVGLSIGKSLTANANAIQTVGFQYMYIEDIGAAV